MNAFLERVLSPSYRGKTNLFWDSLQKLLPPVMYFGAINSLSQTLLKLTCPGVPDVYQGQEMWDFSLVDPDNRRPIDFGLRAHLAEQLTTRVEKEDAAAICRELLHDWQDGRVKLWVTMRALNFRRQHKWLYQKGSYVPLHAIHGREEHVIAFARHDGEDMAITAVPRLSYTLMKGRLEPPVGSAWGDSQLVLPQQAVGRRLRNVLTGEVLSPGQAALCREVFASFPVALLCVE